MTVDVNEAKDGGILRDKYGREQLVAVDKHAVPSITDLPIPDGYTDADGRRQVVLATPTGATLDSAARGVSVKQARGIFAGAVGDGTTNDYAVIQGHVDALGATGGMVWFPKATYSVETSVAIPSNVAVVGEGHDSIIKRPGLTAGKVLVNSDTAAGNTDITVANLTVDRRDGADALDTTLDNAINFKYVSRLRIVNVRARGGMKAIHLQSCSGWLVHPHCDSFRDNGIAINDMLGVSLPSAADQVMHVIAPKLRQTAATKAAAGSSPIIITQSNTLVIEPDIESTVALGGYGIEYGNATTGAHDMRVQGGTLRGCGILIGNGARQTVHDVTLEDGSVAGSARIVCVPTGGGAATTDPSIKRNTISGAAASPNGNLRVESTTGGEVTDNRLRGTAYIFNAVSNTNVNFARNSQEAPNVYVSQEHAGQPGIIAPKTQLTVQLSNTFAPVATTKYVARFVPEKDMTAAGIAFRVVTAAGADDGCDVGIYDAAFNLIASKGNTTGQLNSTGTKYLTFTTPVALKAGRVYFAAFTTSAATAPLALLAYNFLTGGALLLFASSGVNVDTGSEADASPLAATMNPPGGVSQVPVLAVREA